MSQEEDRKFFDTFMLVLAALIVFTVAMYALSVVLQDRTIGDQSVQTPDAQERLAERIAPVGRLCRQGEEDECEVEATAVAEADTPADDDEVDEEMTGQEVYESACSTCHSGGVGGAPVTGDADDWAARLEKGYDTLLEHSIEGFEGDAGYMPPRGGQRGLTDEQVADSLDYMLEQLDDEPAE